MSRYDMLPYLLLPYVITKVISMFLFFIHFIPPSQLNSIYNILSTLFLFFSSAASKMAEITATKAQAAAKAAKKSKQQQIAADILKSVTANQIKRKRE
jgi:high-affinity K+ transport system ATPase subunit B